LVFPAIPASTLSFPATSKKTNQNSVRIHSSEFFFNIKGEMNFPEREALLGTLRDQLSRLHADFEGRSQADVAMLQKQQAEPLGTKNLPEIVMNIVWARQLASKVGVSPPQRVFVRVTD
jgi:hypothetical protein